MSWLLGATLVFCGLTFWAYRASRRGEADDYGAVIPFLFCLLVAVVLVITYVVMALWSHRFF